MIMNTNRRNTIIVCDDDEGILDVIASVLQGRGYSVVSLTHGKKVMETARKVNPVAILLDLWLPDGNGDDVARQLKNRKETKHIPIVLVSANRFTKQIASEVGADAYLCKPFDITELENVVEKYRAV